MNRYETDGPDTIRIQSPLGERQIVTELAEDFSRRVVMYGESDR